MKTNEFLSDQFAHIAYQVDKVFEGLKEDHYDFRVSSKAMTPRETLEHLCEVAEACYKENIGEAHEWGTYTIADKSTENLHATYLKLRKRAIDATLASESPDNWKRASAYIVSHEAYHVGQLCLMRMECESEWDPYSIYKM